MVYFEKEMAHFNYRVAGVVIHDSHILLDRNARNNYWVLPGGHPEMMEPMTDALFRELREEIGAEVEIIRLLWVIENFFHKNKDIHELSFYFLMTLKPNSPLLTSRGPFYGDEYGSKLIYQWHPLNEAALLSLPLYPSFLANALLRLPLSTQHIVFRDPKKVPGSKVDNFLTFP